jgi:ArsR family transcriptional regulator
MQSHQAVSALSALAHEARLAVFRLLVQAGPEGLSAGAIAERLALAPSGLSFHLKELTAAGLLIRQPDGRQVRYSAGYTGMNDLVAYLAANCCQGGACALDAPTTCPVNTDEGPDTY